MARHEASALKRPRRSGAPSGQPSRAVAPAAERLRALCAGARASLSVLVLAAHPDDETIGAAGLLLRSTDAAVLHLSDGAPRAPALAPARGDRSREAYARARAQEARRALAIAGARALPPLGFIDQELALALPALSRAVAAAIEAARPELVVGHPYEGGHPDHDAAAFATRAARALLVRAGRCPPELFEMTSYHGDSGHFVHGAFLDGGPSVGDAEVVRGDDGLELCLTEPEQQHKAAMFEAYASQRDVLARFSIGVERFRPAPRRDFRRAPCEGPLYFESLGWEMTGRRFRRHAALALAALGLEDPGWL